MFPGPHLKPLLTCISTYWLLLHTVHAFMINDPTGFFRNAVTPQGKIEMHTLDVEHSYIIAQYT